MFLTNNFKASGLKYYKISPEAQDKLAVKLVQIDTSFIPPKECHQALREKSKLRLVSKTLYSEEFMMLRMYGLPLLLMMGGVIYSYLILKQKKQPLTNFQEKDYEKLTLWQLKQKENLVLQEKQFDTILDSLQNKLKDEYQETLHEFQDFISK